MIRDLKAIKKYFKNKNVCILGNADSILRNPKDIDSYDIVCRINHGFPKGKEEFIGTKTDIIFMATYVVSRRIINEYKPSFMVWLTPWTHRASNIVKERAIHAPDENWFELNMTLNKKPSSGLMAIYFILKYLSFKKLDIYGFDFFKSGTWYHNTKQKWHDGKKEEALLNNLISDRDNVEIIYE